MTRDLRGFGTAHDTMTKALGLYWYEYFEECCAICSRTTVEKVRVYDRPKPKAWHERHHVIETVCSGHFL